MSDLIFKSESYEIIGACMEVHNELGCGFLEAVYHEALIIELDKQNIPFLTEHKLDIFYKGQKLSKQYQSDFICFDKIIVEIKASIDLSSDNEAQVLNYLKATGYKLGILVNFGRRSLQYKRLVL